MHLLVVSHSCSIPLNQQIYAEIQKQTGWKITLVVPKNWKDEFGNILESELWPDSNLSLLSVPVINNGSIILHAYRANWNKILKELRPDVIYVNHEPYAIATAQVCWANRKIGNKPLGFYSCQNIKKKYPPPFSWLEKFVYKSARFAFPITDDVARVLVGKGFSGNIKVCPLPLDPEIYHPRLKASPPERFERSPNIPVIGFVGRLVESKGLGTLASALDKIKTIYWKLVVLGEGEYGEEFKRLLRQTGLLDKVQFAGYVPHTETPSWLAAMDVLVVPSETQPNWKEQFGRVIPESLACGTPVVGSDSGEIPNLIRESAGGMVFPERNASALAEALEKMLLNSVERERMALNGREWVERHISLHSTASKMIEVFRKVIN